MQKLHFSIIINAPKQKVWDTMLGDKTYRQWTEAFGAGSYFVGSWDQGADMKFLAPNDKGGTGGMISRIKENRPYEYLSIEHLGVIEDGKEDTTSEAVKKWAGALENYTFRETNGATEVLVDMDIEDSYQKMFEEMWPKALQKLKEITESARAITVTVETMINAPLEKVWESWTGPDHIVKWCFASDDWEAPHAENDVRTGGKFKTVMAAKDKSTSFDFGGTYTKVKEFELIEYDMGDGRHVKIEFAKLPEGVKVTETFDIEAVNSKEMQRAGWQAILDNFKKYTEGSK
jgi:uncharacterized protein YndB with AHSA1/START domain